jgi:hypothetical protein
MLQAFVALAYSIGVWIPLLFGGLGRIITLLVSIEEQSLIFLGERYSAGRFRYSAEWKF